MKTRIISVFVSTRLEASLDPCNCHCQVHVPAQTDPNRGQKAQNSSLTVWRRCAGWQKEMCLPTMCSGKCPQAETCVTGRCKNRSELEDLLGMLCLVYNFTPCLSQPNMQRGNPLLPASNKYGLHTLALYWTASSGTAPVPSSCTLSTVRATRRKHRPHRLDAPNTQTERWTGTHWPACTCFVANQHTCMRLTSLHAC